MLDQIRNVLSDSDCIVRRCEDRGCCAHTDGLDTLVVKGELVASGGQSAADCIIFVRSGRAITIVLVELKTRHVRVSSVLEKMANSEAWAKALLKRVGQPPGAVVRAVFARGGFPRVGTAEYVLLTKKGGIRLRRCGMRICDLMTTV